MSTEKPDSRVDNREIPQQDFDLFSVELRRLLSRKKRGVGFYRKFIDVMIAVAAHATPTSRTLSVLNELWYHPMGTVELHITENVAQLSPDEGRVLLPLLRYFEFLRRDEYCSAESILKDLSDLCPSDQHDTFWTALLRAISRSSRDMPHAPQTTSTEDQADFDTQCDDETAHDVSPDFRGNDSADDPLVDLPNAEDGSAYPKVTSGQTSSQNGTVDLNIVTELRGHLAAKETQRGTDNLTNLASAEVNAALRDRLLERLTPHEILSIIVAGFDRLDRQMKIQVLSRFVEIIAGHPSDLFAALSGCDLTPELIDRLRNWFVLRIDSVVDSGQALAESTTLTFGERLRRAREAKGWSTRQLAKAANMQQPAITRYEQGNRDPGTKIIARLAGALGIPTADLMPKE